MTAAPAKSDSPRSDLGNRARSGAKWIVVGFGAGQVLRLAANIALAAILFEEAFALMAIVMAVMQGLGMFSDIGLRPSVVQNRRGSDNDFVHTAWTLQIIRGAVLCILAALLAWPLSIIYGANDPSAFELRWLIPIVALTALIDGLQSSRMLTAAREMHIARTTMLEIVTQLLNAVIMLTLAWYLRSVYALAIAAVASSALRSVLSYWIVPGTNSRLRLEVDAVRSIFSFGKWIFVSTALAFLSIQIDRLVFAGMFPLAEVGVYSIAASLSMLVVVLAGSLQSAVIFPWYSRMLDEGVTMEDAFRKTRAPVLLLSTYVCSLLIVGAQSFFELAYDDRYQQASLFLPILAVGAWFSALESMYGAAFLATGRSSWVAIVGASKVVSFLLLLIPLSLLGGSLTAAALIAVASEIARAMTSQYLGRRMGLKNLRIESMMLGMLALASALGLALTLGVPWVGQLHPIWRLLLAGLVVSLVFSPLALGWIRPLLQRSKA